MAHFFILAASSFMAFSAALAVAAFQTEFPASTISAAPAALQPHPLHASPASSPDITPLLPSPGASDLSPAASSLPVIPSSPSPPNPDATTAPGPGSDFRASELMPSSSTVWLNAQEFFKNTMPALCLVMVAFSLNGSVFLW